MADDVTRRCSDRLQQLSMKLEQSHLVYLQTEESPLKLQQRHKLEGFIKEYLCLVPNDSKYVFQETADILHRSAATVHDFSGYRACTAWSSISLYAANLLAQPWRKEYKTLRTYSGYYKHEVETNLIGAELMFELMGYKHAGLGVLTLEGPIDPDKVSSVSRDAIVAFVECQILKQIWESVSQNFTISWLEVLEFRENHVGTPEQAIRALNYRFLERMHQNRVKPEIYRDYRQLPPINVGGIPPTSPYNLQLNNYNTFSPTCQTDYRYVDETNRQPMNYQYFHPVDYSSGSRYNAYGYPPPDGKFFSGNNVNAYCSAMPTYPTRVPTGQLIELDTPVPVIIYEKANERRTANANLHHGSDLDEVDLHRRQTGNEDHHEYAKVQKKPAKPLPGHENESLDSWEFVFRNLESLGYSKDLGDREDVLHRSELDSNKARQKSLKSSLNNYDNHHASQYVEKRRGNFNFNEIDRMASSSRVPLQEGSVQRKKSSFDELNKSLGDRNYEDQSQFHERNKKFSQTLPTQHRHHTTERTTRVSDSFKGLEISDKNSQNGSKNKWNCPTCTFLNEPNKEICDMCGKSRRKGNEEKPLASGGKECPQCTLVNEKSAANCDACGASLKDSPTYI